MEDINITYGGCMTVYETLGETHYVNICTKEENIVPWGIGGWFLFLTLTTIVIVLIGAIAYLVKLIFKQ